MGQVMTGFSTSVDGFIAGPGDDVSRLFAWYGGGDTEVRVPDGSVFSVSAASAEHIRDIFFGFGALVTGRREYDLTRGWGGRHPLDVPVFVVTHSPPEEPYNPDAPFTFVPEGVAAAIEQARAVAGDKNVAVDGASIVQQAIALGLIDELGIDLVPVLLGAGVRYFDHLGTTPIELERISVIAAPGVTHLRFRVVR